MNEPICETHGTPFISPGLCPFCDENTRTPAHEGHPMNEEVKAVCPKCGSDGDFCISSIGTPLPAYHDERRTRTPASCSPDVVELVQRTRRTATIGHASNNRTARKFADGLTELADALELVMREKDVMGWQPIETAPKDGGALLGCYLTDSSSVTRVMFWDDEDGRWVTAGGGLSHQATHWMPLPAPPRAALDMTLDKGR